MTVVIEDLAKELADTFSRKRTHDGSVGLVWEWRSESAKEAWREVARVAIQLIECVQP